jgi:hypothetical protein
MSDSLSPSAVRRCSPWAVRARDGRRVAAQAEPPRLADAYDKTDRGRLKLHDAEDQIMKNGAWDGGANTRMAWIEDLEVLWNININNSPYLAKKPLDTPGNIKHLEAAIAAKEREVARLQRVLRTRH